MANSCPKPTLWMTPHAMDDTLWGLTHTKLLQCNYTWIIDNFEFCCAEMTAIGSSITSPTFSVKANNTLLWNLRIKRSDNYGDVFTLALELSNQSPIRRQPMACYKFSMLNANQRETNASEVLYFQQSSFNSYNDPVVTDIKFIDKSKLLSQKEELLPDGKLIILCKISVFEERIESSGWDNAQSEAKEDAQNAKCCISDDICKLYDNMTLSDVMLVAGGKEIRAHKTILAARSAVFAAMFEHDMQEQKLSSVDITDVDHDTLIEMLRYIYTGRAHNLDKMAADLLVAADKYALDGLKAICIEPLCKSLSVETAADLLVLADLHSAVRLKTQAIAFINRNATKMKNTSGWNKIISSHPHLVSELFLALSVAMQQHS